MAIVIKPLLFPRHPCREAIPLHMVCQDLYSVFKVLSFGTIILYQTFSDLSRGLLKIFLGNFYQSLNLKEVCIIVVRPMGFEPTRRFRRGILSPPWLPVPPQAHIKDSLVYQPSWRNTKSAFIPTSCALTYFLKVINGTPGGTWTHTSFDSRFWVCPVCQFQHGRI